MLIRIVIATTVVLATIPGSTSLGQLLQMGMDDGAGWEDVGGDMPSSNDSGPLLFREVNSADLVSVRARISAQTVGFWSQAGVIVRMPNPVDGVLNQENWQTSWSFRGAVPAQHQSNSHVDGVESELNVGGLTLDELTYVRLDNMGGGTFLAYRGTGPENNIVWTPLMDGMMMPQSQTNANLSGGTLQVGLAAGALGAAGNLPGASTLWDWVEIETTSQIFRDDFDYVHDFTTGVPGFNAGATTGGGIWNGILNADAGTMDTTSGPDLGRCLSCIWDSVGSDDFNDLGNWSPAILFAPNGNNVSATFGDVMNDMGELIRTDPSTVFTNIDVTLRDINFDSSVGYVFGGAGSITLEADTGNASLNVLEGTHEVQANIVLNSDTDATAATDSVLDVNAEVDLNGNTLTISGAGAVNLNNGVLLGGGQLINGAGSLAGLSSVAGDFTQTAGGSLAVEVGAGAIDVLGAANLAGTLNASLAEGLTLSRGDIFTILTADSVNDLGLELGTGANQFRLLLGPSSVALAAAIPEPSTACLIVLAFLSAGLTWCRRRTGLSSKGSGGFVVCAILAAHLWCATAAVQAQCPECGLFRDEFDVEHDYSGALSGGDPGTVPEGGIWDGIYNPVNGGDAIEPGFFVSDGADFFGNEKPGVLFIEDLHTHVNTNEALGIGWEGQGNNAPFLFKEVPAHRDFTATMQISAETNGNWSHTPIMARIAGPEVGRGPGDMIDDENFVNVGSFRATAVPENSTLLMQNVIDGDEAETNQNLFPAGEGGAPLPVWVRLEKAGQLFTGSMSLDGVNFESNDALSFVNAAFMEGETMEVGLGHWRYFGAATSGEAEIEFFEIEIRESVRHTMSDWGGGSATWNEGLNWDSDAPGAIPNANSVTATMGDVVTGPTTIFNDEAVVLRGLVFDSPNPYAITGHGSISLEPDPQGEDSTTLTSINVMQGSHELQLELGYGNTAGNDNHISAEAGARMDINNALNLNGKQVFVEGDGRVNVNNNIDTGTAGTLIVNGGHLGGTGRVNGGVTNGQAGMPGTVSPGTSIGTLTVEGTFQQQATGTLEIEIGGLDAGEFDVVQGLSIALLNGTVDASLVNGFQPTVGDTWQILTATNIVDQGIAIAAADASSFELIVNQNNLMLQFLGGGVTPTGDYNGDGVVNAADYTVWRNTLGDTVTPGNGADGDADGVIGGGDYDFWKARYGNVVGSGTGSSAVPEPNSVSLLMIVGLLVPRLGRLNRR